MNLTNWGNYPRIDTELKSFASEEELRRIVAAAEVLIPRGLGRCYGDSALGRTVISALNFNRMLHFDGLTGEFACEAGVTFEEILQICVPRGWFLPTTPGTKFVTIGGAIASDVHGKNHHLAGSFARHVRWIDLMLSSGKVVRCSKDHDSELFWATCGGMGLTGIVLRAAFSLVPIETAYIRQETVRASNLDEIMASFEESAGWTYTVAWIDCLKKGEHLGRSIMMRGEHAVPDELLMPAQRAEPLSLPEKRKLNIPFNLPGFMLNAFTVRAFNALYYGKAPKKKTTSIVDYDSFFYPLDSIHNWNRIYGKRGFTQYQFVLPKASSKEGLRKILNRIASSGQGSFLAVLKLFGEQEGMISFPMKGYTLALDFPINKGLFPLLDELDQMVLDYGGRIYLTKDVRMAKAVFDRGYAHADAFRSLRHRFDPEGKFASLQSRRLGL